MKILIDTNVVLDALMDRFPNAEPAKELMLAVAADKAEGYITASSFTDLHFILKKNIKSDESARQKLLGLLALVNILDVSETDCRKAFELPMKDLEDALLAYCGKRHKMDYIVTQNIDDFKGSPVKAIKPDEFILELT